MVGGIDIGGSRTKACLVADGAIVATATVATEPRGAQGLAMVAVSALNKAMADAGYARDRLDAVGIGVPGQVTGGWVRHAANLGVDGAGVDLGSQMTGATGLRAVVENDMRCAAFGAYSQLATGNGALANLVYVGLGTGVSAGVVLNGAVYRGSRGLAGEFGHVALGAGQPCVCGSVGCLETVVGAGALGRRWRGGPASELFASAARGDEAATAIAREAIDHLARSMWWLAATYDPDLFFIGGGVGANSPYLRQLLVSRWEEMAAPSGLARSVLDPDRIRIYDLDEPVGAFGAALLAMGAAERSGKRSESADREEEESHE